MVNFKTAPTLADRAIAYVMEVSTEKSMVMTNSTNNIGADY